MDLRLETKVSELTEVTRLTDNSCGFADRVKKAIPRVKIGQRTNGKDGAYHYVYMDGHPHVMGYLYYGDLRENPKDYIDHYCVSSTFIHNGKYADYNNNYNVAMSTNLDQALKNAKKYLRPLPWGVVSGIHYRKFRHKFYESRNHYRDEFNASTGKVGLSRDYLIPELQQLIDSGHVFMDNELHNNIVDMLNKRKAYQEDKQKEIRCSFVYGYMKWNTENYAVVDIEKQPSKSLWHTLESTTYTADTLPENIKGRVMALNVLDDDMFVDDVGYKIGDNMFYVLP